MYKNNFDKSSTGIDIELSCSRDCDLSRHWWEENFEVLQHESYSKTGKYWYIDNGNVPGSDSVQFELHGDFADVKKFLLSEGYDESDFDGKDWQGNLYTEQTWRDEIINRLDSISVLTYRELNEYDLKDTGLELVPSKTIEQVEIRGYCQGDYAIVLYSPDDLESAWGVPPNQSQLKETFERLFYDAPIYARFEINGEEYNYYDYIADEYDWQPEQFAQGVAKDSGIDAEKLMAMLPEYPDYN